MRRQLATVLVALMLVTAGCSGFGGPGNSSEPSDGTSDDATGSITFFISDQPGAIEDFEHLNVTISKVGFHRANASDADDETDGNETDTGDEEMEDGEWQEFDVDSRTVDLTELQGANATALQQFEVENGTYNKVFIHVSDVNGTLEDGSSADVKLPSSKLRLNQQFTVGNNESVDFVYDISVVERGNSGSYNIKPVASESGTDVDIQEVGEDDGDDGDDGDDESTATPNGTDAQQSMGQVDFYMSDEKNAIGDFEHLNVTVSKVGFRRGGESGNWTEHDVDNRTVDLTRLKGDNATLLRTFNVSEGNYTKVFVHVSDVNGTLVDGNETAVKLPSSKLQLNENFEVGDNESVDFVYDITVVERGNSGSYNVKPVASESGTDVPIDDVDREDEREEDHGQGDDEGDEMADNETGTEAPSLNATFVGNVTQGGNATVYVSQNGTAVENATVTSNGTEYLTNADGNVTFQVPSDAEKVEVEVTYENRTVTLTETFEDESGAEPNSGNSDGNQNADDGGSSGTETATATPTPTATAES